MSFLDTIFNVNIVANSATPTRENFGTPAIAAYHTHNSDKIRTYFDASDLLSDGFLQTDVAYRMAQMVTQQNPHAPSFKLIRLGTPVIQSVAIQVLDHAVGDSVGFTVVGPDGVSHTVTHLNGGSETNSTVATALQAALSVVTGATATVTTDTVTLVGNAAGTTFVLSALNGVSVKDNTPAASVAADLAAANAVDSNWYGLTTQYLDGTNLTAASTWSEANDKIHSYMTGDTENLTSGSGIGNALKALGYNNSVGFFSFNAAQYLSAGLMSQRFTDDPGSDTWAYKNVIGATPDKLSATQITALQANNLNFYTSIAGLPLTFEGKAASGQFIDLQRGLDALRNDIQIRVLTLFSQLKKDPYTPGGIRAVVSCVQDALDNAVSTGFLSGDAGYEPKAIGPDFSRIVSSDKTARILRGVKFTALATGAIHRASPISGTVNF